MQAGAPGARPLDEVTQQTGDKRKGVGGHITSYLDHLVSIVSQLTIDHYKPAVI